MRRVIEGSAALAQDDAASRAAGPLGSQGFAPASGIVIAASASLLLWVGLLLLARWVAYALF